MAIRRWYKVAFQLTTFLVFDRGLVAAEIYFLAKGVAESGCLDWFARQSEAEGAKRRLFANRLSEFEKCNTANNPTMDLISYEE